MCCEAQRGVYLHPRYAVSLVRKPLGVLNAWMWARELGNGADWLLRCQHNRALPEGGKLWAQVLKGEPLGEIRFTLPRKRGAQSSARAPANPLPPAGARRRRRWAL